MTDPVDRAGWSCTLPFRVRFDEAGPDGLLRTSSLLRYAQDLASYHSADRGFDRAWYAERGLAWLARAAVVTVLAPVVHGTALSGTTRVVGERRVWARRRTEFSDTAGVLVAWTHVDWVLLDGRGGPTRIPPAFEGAFGTPKADFPLGRVKLDPPPAETARLAFHVRPQELDPMDHVNNAVYADWLDEVVAAPVGRRRSARSRASCASSTRGPRSRPRPSSARRGCRPAPGPAACRTRRDSSSCGRASKPAAASPRTSQPSDRTSVLGPGGTCIGAPGRDEGGARSNRTHDDERVMASPGPLAHAPPIG